MANDFQLMMQSFISKFSQPIGIQVRTLAEQHLGVLGPSIRAEVGDTVHVVFRNTVRFPTSIHVHGLLYDKRSEGAPYADGTSGEQTNCDGPHAMCNASRWYRGGGGGGAV